LYPKHTLGQAGGPTDYLLPSVGFAGTAGATQTHAFTFEAACPGGAGHTLWAGTSLLEHLAKGVSDDAVGQTHLFRAIHGSIRDRWTWGEIGKDGAIRELPRTARSGRPRPLPGGGRGVVGAKSARSDTHPLPRLAGMAPGTLTLPRCFDKWRPGCYDTDLEIPFRIARLRLASVGHEPTGRCDARHDGRHKRLAVYPLDTGQHHPLDPSLLLYWHIDVGAALGWQRARPHSHGDGNSNSYRDAIPDSFARGGRTY